MFTIEQAQALVESLVCRRPSWLRPDDELIVYSDETIERSWGWVFFHGSRQWRDTGDSDYALAGNAPVFVERDSGRVSYAGTANPVQYYIDNFERTGSPHGRASIG